MTARKPPEGGSRVAGGEYSRVIPYWTARQLAAWVDALIVAESLVRQAGRALEAIHHPEADREARALFSTASRLRRQRVDE